MGYLVAVWGGLKHVDILYRDVSVSSTSCSPHTTCATLKISTKSMKCYIHECARSKILSLSKTACLFTQVFSVRGRHKQRENQGVSAGAEAEVAPSDLHITGPFSLNLRITRRVPQASTLNYRVFRYLQHFSELYLHLTSVELPIKSIHWILPFVVLEILCCHFIYSEVLLI